MNDPVNHFVQVTLMLYSDQHSSVRVSKLESTLFVILAYWLSFDFLLDFLLLLSITNEVPSYSVLMITRCSHASLI